ncbi:MAG TPA: cation transporter [Thermoanaerobacterales bacterium]|nr:cation transporter [Thermoanaerobacterales bacterium]
MILKEATENNGRKIQKVLWIVLGLNFLVSIMKLVVGYSISSASMVADGFHSFSDGSSNIIGLIGTAIASRPPDKDHPYGHRKYETFTAIGIALMLFMVSINIIKSGIDKIFHPRLPQVDEYGFLVMVITMVVNIFVITYESSQGKKLHSDILVSDAMHTKSDVYVSLSVILSLIAVKMGYPMLDPLISFVIAVLIIRAALEILINSSKVLCDAAVIDPEEVISLVSSIDGVVDCHAVRTRGREDDFSMDLHILVKPDMTVEQSHDLHHTIENSIRKNFEGVHYIDIHIEPYEGAAVES